jgi:hypothetical protein
MLYTEVRKVIEVLDVLYLLGFAGSALGVAFLFSLGGLIGLLTIDKGGGLLGRALKRLTYNSFAYWIIVTLSCATGAGLAQTGFSEGSMLDLGGAGVMLVFVVTLVLVWLRQQVFHPSPRVMCPISPTEPLCRSDCDMINRVPKIHNESSHSCPHCGATFQTIPIWCPVCDANLEYE